MAKFIPPTIDEVKAYIKEKNLNVDAVIFWNYYTEQDWKDSRNKPVLNWKGKMWAVWHSKHPKTIQQETIKREQELAKEKRERDLGGKNINDLFRELARPVLKEVPESTARTANQLQQQVRANPLKAEPKQSDPLRGERLKAQLAIIQGRNNAENQ